MPLAETAEAILGYRQNDILVSEATIPAMPLMQSGRIYAEMSPDVKTGIAIANPNTQPVTVDFYFTDSAGLMFGRGATTIKAGGQISAFLDSSPFNGLPDLNASFTFSATTLVSAYALRGFTTFRGDFLMTSLPVAPVTNAAASPATTEIIQILPQFATGGGWNTTLIIVNPGDAVLSGEFAVYSSDGQPLPIRLNEATAATFTYSISPRSYAKFESDSSLTNVQVSSIRITSNSQSPIPAAFAIFRYAPAGAVLSEAGVTATQPRNSTYLYVESAGVTRSGLALANPQDYSITVQLAPKPADGSLDGPIASLSIPANGQVSLFLNEVPGLESLLSFKGTVQLLACCNRFSPPGVAATGLRTRVNERGDFLMTATEAVTQTRITTSTELLFPHFRARRRLQHGVHPLQPIPSGSVIGNDVLHRSGRRASFLIRAAVTLVAAHPGGWAASA